METNTTEIAGRRAAGPGLSPGAFARTVPVPISRVRKAIERGELEVIDFGGRQLIPASEVPRVRALYRLDDSESPKEQKLVFIFGPGGNGKGVF